MQHPKLEPHVPPPLLCRSLSSPALRAHTPPIYSMHAPHRAADRHGGGGFQEGQNRGVKTGKTGHGRGSGHDASAAQREVQKRDKNGLPLNYGPFRNGYYVGHERKPSATPESTGLGAAHAEKISSLLNDAAASGGTSRQAAEGSAKGAPQEGAVVETLADAYKEAVSLSTTPPPVVAEGAGGERRGKQRSRAPRRREPAAEWQREESARLAAAQQELEAAPQHQEMRSARQSLPAFTKRAELLQALADSEALVVCGETGCGKSTQDSSRVRRVRRLLRRLMAAAAASAQVPQYILEEAIALGEGSACTVLIAQPRRVAAVSLAERVAAERGEGVGKSVGYSIRHEAKQAQSTRLLFCTTGVILRRLQDDPLLTAVSHVVVDEAHERTADGDFLLMVLRRALARRNDPQEAHAPLKVILMSATIDAALFGGYFDGAAELYIPGRTFAVTPLFLEDALELTAHKVKTNADWAKRQPREGPVATLASTGAGVEAADDEALTVQQLRDRYPLHSSATAQALSQLSHSAINFELLAQCVTALLRHDATSLAQFVAKHRPPQDSSQPADEELRIDASDGYAYSFAEFVEFYEGLAEGGKVWESSQRCVLKPKAAPPSAPKAKRGASVEGNDGGAILVFLPGIKEITTLYDMLKTSEGIDVRWLLPLHSTVPAEQQMRAFQRPPQGVRKVVLATNIAETSITIDDVSFVVDCARLKENRFDPLRRMESLVEDFCSRANLLQRRGRAGRVRDGFCIHLLTSHRYATRPAQQTPELQRVPLEHVVLRAKVLYPDAAAHEVLSELPEPPSSKAVRAALSVLTSLGAIERGVARGVPTEALTALGEHLALLPVDVRIGKLLLLGAVLGCGDAAAALAAALSVRSPFSAPFGMRSSADESKANWAIGGSDHIAVLRAFLAWEAMPRERERREFCQEHFLAWRTLESIAEVKKELNQLLSEIGFIKRGGNSGASAPPFDAEMLKAILVGAMWPKVAKIELPLLQNSGKGRGKGGKGGGGKGGGKGASRGGGGFAEPKLKVKDDTGVSEATLHPSCVYAQPTSKLPRSGLLVYGELVKTSALYIRDVTAVSPTAVMLFGGRLSVDPKASLILIDDGWVKFRASQNLAGQVVQLRQEFDRILRLRISQPDVDSSGAGNGLINGVVSLISDPDNSSAIVH
ncbi:hypothetical protein AB1Y20_009565 [Prymnesium parvum]|uniref:RNA helicase n=1 Tax=Prymnesium parvum TaxID=97485 RepID=A0AB34K5B4_PRYPA